jgi:hypothetical protein
MTLMDAKARKLVVSGSVAGDERIAESRTLFNFLLGTPSPSLIPLNKFSARSCLVVHHSGTFKTVRIFHIHLYPSSLDFLRETRGKHVGLLQFGTHLISPVWQSQGLTRHHRCISHLCQPLFCDFLQTLYLRPFLPHLEGQPSRILLRFAQTSTMLYCR